MPVLTIKPVDDSPEAAALVGDWRRIHNAIIPNHPLTAADIRERARRNRLEVACLGEAAVGCSTLRPPGADAEDPGLAVVIARVLPEHRGRGVGSALYARALAAAVELGAERIETLVLERNTAGLDFALRRGFTEIERYALPGDVVEVALGGLPAELLAAVR
ncbi:GNAT family N-acetyltransferase [Streptomyces polyrhachis]|uniref:GNAT family N-acetyltransferase n=1 Tax=Streptomyces polyrhachis TaxID=1282885 RepID=A0ABW2GF61_9ACTN